MQILKKNWILLSEHYTLVKSCSSGRIFFPCVLWVQQNFHQHRFNFKKIEIEKRVDHPSPLSTLIIESIKEWRSVFIHFQKTKKQWLELTDWFLFFLYSEYFWYVCSHQNLKLYWLVRKSPAVEVSETTPTSKYFQISLNLIEQKNRNFDLFRLLLQEPAKTVQILSILLNFGAKISDFDFLFSKALTYDEKITFFRLHGLRTPRFYLQIIFMCKKHNSRIYCCFQIRSWNWNPLKTCQDISIFPLQVLQNHKISQKSKNSKFLNLHFFSLKTTFQDIFSQN